VRWLSSGLACGSPRKHRVRVESGPELEVSVMVEERNFAELASEFACDNFRKRHKAGLRVGRHGEAALRRSCAVSSADPSAENEGVATVEGDGWLKVDRSRRVRHVILGESPYLACQLSVYRQATKGSTRSR
jgi:hypothetical protein